MSYLPMIAIAVFIMAVLLALALTPNILDWLEERRRARRHRRKP